jgi:hypothetical protein
MDALKSGRPWVVYELRNDGNVGRGGRQRRHGTTRGSLPPASGIDCGSDSEVFRVLCSMDPACQPFETFLDPMRRQLGSHFDEVDRRATDLNARIDAGRFDELGL